MVPIILAEILGKFQSKIGGRRGLDWGFGILK